MILVTGAAGKTGRAVLRALIQKSLPVRALVHQPEQISIVSSLGAKEALVGDLNSLGDIKSALEGVSSIYHICPNVSPDEVPIAELLIEASKAARVEHIVYHSVLKPQIEAMPHHWKKLRVEEMLISSGLPYTILQPATYMQNVLAQWGTITTEGCYPIPYAVETRLSLVDLDDVASVAALVLNEPGHAYAVYELAGEDGLSQNQVAEMLSQVLDRPVRATTVPIESWQAQAIAAGMGKYQVQTLISMFRYYQLHNFLGNPHTLGDLLGRKPTDFKSFLERIVLERSSNPVPSHQST
jgi:NAD(P)H dehydrogenase (quinone)